MISDNISCESAYISVASNSSPFAADWGRNNAICFAADNGVAILKPELENDIPGKVVDTYFAHKSRVNVVKWIKNLSNEEPEDGFISASVDKTAIVWTKSENGFIPAFLLGGHTESVTDAGAVSVTLENGEKCVIAATITMESLFLWKKTSTDENFTRINTLNSNSTEIGVSGIDFCIIPHTRTLLLAAPKKFINVCLHTCYLSLAEPFQYNEQQILRGHSNWINDLAFTYTDSEETVLLASASHDGTIHVWRMKPKSDTENSGLQVQETLLHTEKDQFAVTIYSVLYGHDQWVYSVDWKHFEEETEENKLKLMSVSADKSIIIWNRDLSVDTWVENYRLGDIGGDVSGFVGGKFSPNGDRVMGHDLHGAFHVWKYEKEKDTWSSRVLPSGHFGEVHDIQWDPKGKYLLSVSADKTSRLHAPWKENELYWYELARPQTHGYSILCAAVFSSYRFISGATEKELRSFIAPKTFIDSFDRLSFLGSDIDESKYTHKSAILPSLDLSNKPAEEVPNVEIDLIHCNGDTATAYCVPTEDELARNTLWPEVQKLYYHPNEMSSIAINRSETLVASACKATAPKQAVVAIWSVNGWEDITKVQELAFHQLTVTQLAFSPDDLYLLTVSRDRSWCLYEAITGGDTEKFRPLAYASKTDAIHKRQLNCCAWSHDSKYFATGSRDGKLVIWSKCTKSGSESSTLNGYGAVQTVTFTEDITTIAFAPGFVCDSSDYLFAVGFGNGEIKLRLWKKDQVEAECRHSLTMDKTMAHDKTISRLLFRPVFGTGNLQDKSKLQLASCGSDCLVKIYTLSWCND